MSTPGVPERRFVVDTEKTAREARRAGASRHRAVGRLNDSPSDRADLHISTKLASRTATARMADWTILKEGCSILGWRSTRSANKHFDVRRHQAQAISDRTRRSGGPRVASFANWFRGFLCVTLPCEVSRRFRRLPCVSLVHGTRRSRCSRVSMVTV